MNLTFGIMTTYDNIEQLWEVIHSIEQLHVPNAEIIIVGSYGKFDADIIPDFEGRGISIRQILTDGWLPKKKNLVAKFALHDTLVLLHDYYLFDPSWYARWVAFNKHMTWDVASNAQYLLNGKRHFTDWVIWDHPTLPRYHSLGYQDWVHTQHQYISGGFFLVRRDFLRQYPINETMPPGSPEDVEWSLRIRDRGVLCCNGLAIVRHNKVHRDTGRSGFPYEQ